MVKQSPPLSTKLLPSFYSSLKNEKNRILVGDFEATFSEFDCLAIFHHIKEKPREQTAQILNLSPNSVDTHLRNFRADKNGYLKIPNLARYLNNCDEASQNALQLHYRRWEVEDAFQKDYLQSLKSKHLHQQKGFLRVDRDIDQSQIPIKQFEKHLKLAGIDLTLDEDKDVSFSFHITKGQENYLSPDEAQEASGIVILIDDHISRNHHTYDLPNHDDYYIALLRILHTLYPSQLPEEKIEEFKKKQEALLKGCVKIKQRKMSSLKKTPSPKLLYVLLVATVAFWVTKASYDILYSVPKVHSELSSLPENHAFLDRRELIKKIEEKFNDGGDIKVVGIVGIGGAGKTTLAYHYARLQETPVIWAINAETKESLLLSFQNLANNLANTPLLREQLRSISELGDYDKEKRLFMFITRLLKRYPNWILIYDNVEDYTQLKRYFPHSSRVWGKGSVIITSQDMHISNTSYIKPDKIVIVEGLKPRESLSLFKKIFFNSPDHPLSEPQKEEITNFLKKIPPLPLDVSLAAYYLKETGISFNSYSQHLNKKQLEFEKMQKEVLGNTSFYKETRLSIADLTFKKIVQINQEFKELLFLVGLLDSQNIPRNFLYMYKDSLIVDNFIYQLKKYSLITNESHGTPLGTTFSIHRFMHTVMFSNTRESLEPSKQKAILEKAAAIFENYANSLLEKIDLSEMKFFIPHCDMFLKHTHLISPRRSARIYRELGDMYYYLRDDRKAKKLLEESLKINRDDNPNDIDRAHVLVFLSHIDVVLGKNKKAQLLLKKVEKKYKEVLKKNTLEVGRLLVAMGEMYGYLGRFKKAKEVVERGYKIHQKFHDLIGFARTMAYLGVSLGCLGDYEKAIPLMEKSLEIYKKHYKSDINYAWLLVHLGEFYGKTGNYKKALQLINLGTKSYKDNLPHPHADIAWALLYQTGAYLNLKNIPKAQEAAEEGMKVHKMLFDENNVRMAEAKLELARVYKEIRKLEEAENLLHSVLEKFQDSFGKNNLWTASAHFHLAEVYTLKRNFSDAEPHYAKAISILEEFKHPDLKIVLHKKKDLRSRITLEDSENKQTPQGNFGAVIKKIWNKFSSFFPDKTRDNATSPT